MSDVPPSKDMAEQDTHQYTADANEGETQPPSSDHASASKQEELDIAEVEHSEASSSASTNREAKDDNGEDKEQTGVKNDDSAEEEIVPLAEGSSPDGDSTLPVEDNSTPPQVDNGSCGDYNRETKEQQAVVVEEITSECFYQSDDRSDLQIQENTPSTETSLSQEISEEKEMDTEAIDQRNNVQTIGATTQKMTEPTVSVVTGSPGGSGRFLITVSIVVVVAVAILMQHLLQPESPPQKDDVRQIDIFLAQMDKLTTQFPNQRAELWKRSKIHLLRHLQMAQPTEPVSLILTAGVRAEKTLRCLAQGLASAFSSPLNASVLHIDGASKASEDSDQVKLDIDSKLQGAFEGDKPVAVIHRFEELPPGSTLIFYRYCDHENAAYKKTFLIFTVLLGEEEEIPAKSRLSTVEEMVDDHLQKKFLSDGHPVSFDRMDLDKYGGLWSRISHLILPVAAEERMELEGCIGT